MIYSRSLPALRTYVRWRGRCYGYAMSNINDEECNDQIYDYLGNEGKKLGHDAVCGTTGGGERYMY